MTDEIQEAMIQLAIDEMADEVVEAIRSDERDMILAFLRSDEWMYSCCEEAADAIEDLQHYDDEEIH